VIDEARTWRRRMGGTLFHLTPYAVSALAGLKERLPRMGEYAAWARSLASELTERGLKVNPDPPHTNTFLVYAEGDVEAIRRRKLDFMEQRKIEPLRRLGEGPGSRDGDDRGRGPRRSARARPGPRWRTGWPRSPSAEVSMKVPPPAGMGFASRARRGVWGVGGRSMRVSETKGTAPRRPGGFVRARSSHRRPRPLLTSSDTLTDLPPTACPREPRAARGKGLERRSVVFPDLPPFCLRYAATDLLPLRNHPTTDLDAQTIPPEA